MAGTVQLEPDIRIGPGSIPGGVLDFWYLRKYQKSILMCVFVRVPSSFLEASLSRFQEASFLKFFLLFGYK